MADEEVQSLLSTKSISPSPDTVNKLVMRLRAMTFKLLPVQIDFDQIRDSTSRSNIITPEVLKAYAAAAGDFTEALPYALIRARQTFVYDASHNPADYDENMGRAMTCEVIARRLIHDMHPDKLMPIMSARFRYRRSSGDVSEVSSALEAAVDGHCTIFLSSSEAQPVVNTLWRGDWVQVSNDDNDIDYVPYRQTSDGGFWGRLDPSRIGVPQYQNHFRILIWIFFLFVYSQAVREPLYQLDPLHYFDAWEYLLYGMAIAFSSEELSKMYKMLRFSSWKALRFWTVIGVITDTLLVTALVFRIAGLVVTDNTRSDFYHVLSFRVLSCVAPLIWMRLLTVFDGFKYIGTMQICVAYMLRESSVFFALLSILLFGFTQGMYALDISDGKSEGPMHVVNTLLEAFMQAPDFSKPAGGSFGLVMFYLWMVCSTVVLLNILISLFSSAYQSVVDDAEAQYLAFFAGKTIGMIRAPDQYVYPAPFNLIEGVLLVPLECFVSPATYAKMNRTIMRIVFGLPLSLIALYESQLHYTTPKFMRSWMHNLEATDDDSDKYSDPEVTNEGGLVISKIKFAELTAKFPDTAMSSEATLMQELAVVRAQLAEIMERLGRTDSLSTSANPIVIHDNLA